MLEAQSSRQNSVYSTSETTENPAASLRCLKRRLVDKTHYIRHLKRGTVLQPPADNKDGGGKEKKREEKGREEKRRGEKRRKEKRREEKRRAKRREEKRREVK